MRIKFNKLERVAGLFVLVAVVGSFVVGVSIAVKKGWFSSKINFSTTLENAEGINQGTMVQISGLRAGEVYDIELISGNEIIVRFEVLERFHKNIKMDSKVMVVRPFIIGEKVIDITIGSEGEAILPPESKIVTMATFDIMDIMSGRKLGPFMDDMEKMMGNLKILVDAFTERKRTESFVRIFDKLEPLIENMNHASTGFVGISSSMNKNKRFEGVMRDFTAFSKELAIILPEMKKQVPQFGKKMGQMITNFSILAEEFKELTPAITAVAPDLPRAGVRAIEALDEAVVLLKAMQKSFLLSGNVEDVRADEEKLKKALLIKLKRQREMIDKKRRLPAGAIE